MPDNSGTNMSDQEIVFIVVDKWLTHVNRKPSDDERKNGLDYIRANGLHEWIQLLADEAEAVAFRAKRGQ